MIVFSGAFWEGWSDMIDAMQIGALILLAIVAIGWIRRRLRRSVAIAVVMSALLFALALPQQAAAAEVRRGRSISIPAGEVVHNDLIAAGPSVRIDGTVEGDVIAFTREPHRDRARYGRRDCLCRGGAYRRNRGRKCARVFAQRDPAGDCRQECNGVWELGRPDLQSKCGRRNDRASRAKRTWTARCSATCWE